MSVAASLGLIWVVLISLVALTPYPWHRNLALALLVIFPVLLVAIGWEVGWFWALLFLAAGVSIYRKPLGYYWRKLRARDGEK